MGLYEDARSRWSDRGNENKWPAQEDHRREHKTYHLGNTSNVMSIDYIPLSGLSSLRPVITSKGRENQHDDRRPLSPVTSFLDQIELDNGRLFNAPGMMHRKVSTDHRYLTPYDRNGDRHINGDISTAVAVSSNTLKRPAQSPVQDSTNDSIIKRQRKAVTESESSSKPEARTMPAYSSHQRLEPETEQARHQLQEAQPAKELNLAGNICLYVNASTQTEKFPIASSKIAILQEEAAIAQAKHEADMTRRKQALALELEHERKVLELRHHFKLSSAIKAQPASVTNDSHSPEPTGPVKPRTPVIIDDFEREGMGDVQNTRSAVERIQSAQQLRAVGTAQDSRVVPQMYPKAESVGTKRLTTTEQGHDPYHKPDSRDQRSTAGNPDRSSSKDQDKSVSRPKGQPGSSSSTSVQIKTSISPRPVKRKMLDVDKERWPKVNHLTCYFWKNGHCAKTAAQCSYAHYDTGVVATSPDTIKRTRRDGPYYKPGRW